jgi:hypothetical protein
MQELTAKGKWPCFFFSSDTTGEKDFEEFYTEGEDVDWDRYSEIGIVKNSASANQASLDAFSDAIAAMRERAEWTKSDMLRAFGLLLPHFNHLETGKYLDNRM